jgi:hypothetical protein
MRGAVFPPCLPIPAFQEVAMSRIYFCIIYILIVFYIGISVLASIPAYAAVEAYEINE